MDLIKIRVAKFRVYPANEHLLKAAEHLFLYYGVHEVINRHVGKTCAYLLLKMSYPEGTWENQPDAIEQWGKAQDFVFKAYRKVGEHLEYSGAETDIDFIPCKDR